MWFVMSAYIVASCDQIKLLFGHGREERICDYFGALFAAGKPARPIGPIFGPPRNRPEADGAQTIVIPY